MKTDIIDTIHWNILQITSEVWHQNFALVLFWIFSPFRTYQYIAISITSQSLVALYILLFGKILIVNRIILFSVKIHCYIIRLGLVLFSSQSASNLVNLVMHVSAYHSEHINKWCFRQRFCTIRLYWARVNLGQGDDIFCTNRASGAGSIDCPADL